MNNNKSIKETRMSNTIPREPNKAPLAPREILLATNGENLKYSKESEKIALEKSIFNRFCRLLQIENPMLLTQMAEYLQIDEIELMKRLIIWKQKLPFTIRHDRIYIPNMDEFLRALDRIPS